MTLLYVVVCFGSRELHYLTIEKKCTSGIILNA